MSSRVASTPFRSNCPCPSCSRGQPCVHVHPPETILPVKASQHNKEVNGSDPNTRPSRQEKEDQQLSQQIIESLSLEPSRSRKNSRSRSQEEEDLQVKKKKKSDDQVDQLAGYLNEYLYLPHTVSVDVALMADLMYT